MFEAVKTVVGEHVDNRKLIMKVALEDVNKKMVRTTLGIGWDYVHDIIYFFVFIMFRYLISRSGTVDGVDTISYLVTGLVPWFWMSEVLTASAVAIKAKKSIIQSMSFPITTIPTIDVLSVCIKRIFSFVIVFIVVAIFSGLQAFNIWSFLYYTICLVVILEMINLTISAFVAISTDFHQFYLSFIRVLMYAMPILWSFGAFQNSSPVFLLKLNPLVYVMIGLRSAFLPIYTNSLEYTLYFWVAVIVLFFFGCSIQYRLRKYYADIM